nr:ABA4-like family protein [Hymenobacter siberiensis]
MAKVGDFTRPQPPFHPVVSPLRPEIAGPSAGRATRFGPTSSLQPHAHVRFPVFPRQPRGPAGLGAAGTGPALARHPRRGAKRGAAAATAAAYAVLIAAHYAGPHGGEGGFQSLDAVAALFRDPWALLAGWVHYLCFDMWTGAWEVRDAQRRGMPHGLLIPCLLLTFLFGPVGLLLYFGVRQRYPLPPTDVWLSNC